MNDMRTLTVPLPSGKTTTLLRETAAAAGTRTVVFPIDSDSVLISLWVDSITSGSLDVAVYTQTEDGKQTQIISFPTISAPTAELLLRKAALAMSVVKVVVTTTGIATFEVRAKGLAIGETTSKILGAGSLSTSSATVTTTPGQLITAALTDRNGVTIKNYAGGGTLFVSEDQAKLTTDAWPIGPGEVWSLDVSAGVTLYAVASAGSLDIRIAESGE
jgi:hypothetical protein